MKVRILPALSRLLAIGVVYSIVILFGNLPDHLILFPSRNAIDPAGAVRKTISFRNGQLELWTAKSKVAQKKRDVENYMLRFYGNADRAERWVAAEAEVWNDRAVEIWGMNYPGFGGSTGPAKLALVAPAALTAFDALNGEAAGRPVVLFGASLGATAALHVAAHRPVAGLILHNPPALRPIVLRQFGWWNLWLLAGPIALQIPKDLDSIANAKAIHRPAIFLLAEKDEIVPPRFQQLVVDAYGGEKRVIGLRAANHNSPIEGDGLIELHKALDWLLPRKI